MTTDAVFLRAVAGRCMPWSPLRPQSRRYGLDEAQRALEDLRAGRVRGTEIIIVGRADTAGPTEPAQ